MNNAPKVPEGMKQQLQEASAIAEASKAKGEGKPRAENVAPPSGTLVSIPNADYKLFFGWVSIDGERKPIIGRFRDEGRLEVTGIFLGQAEMDATLAIVSVLDDTIVLDVSEEDQ